MPSVPRLSGASAARRHRRLRRCGSCWSRTTTATPCSSRTCSRSRRPRSSCQHVRTLAEALQAVGGARLRAAGPQPARRDRASTAWALRGRARPRDPRPHRPRRRAARDRGAGRGRPGLPHQGPRRRQPARRARSATPSSAGGPRTPSASSRSRAQASENARLERGLLPTPLVADAALGSPPTTAPAAGARCSGATSTTSSRTARRDPRDHRRRLRPRRRTRRRSASPCGSPGARSCSPASPPTSVLPRAAGRPRGGAPCRGVFTTLADARRSRRTAAALDLRSAGHPPPLLLHRAPRAHWRPAGRPPARRRGRRALDGDAVELPPDWALLLYTDGRDRGPPRRRAPQRLGEHGLPQLVRRRAARHPRRAQAACATAGRARRAAQRRSAARRRGAACSSRSAAG